jgi:hypothetical protein
MRVSNRLIAGSQGLREITLDRYASYLSKLVNS